VAVTEVVLLIKIILDKEEISMIKVALVSPLVVITIMPVGMATMILVAQEAILAVVRHYVKFGNYNNKFSHFGPMCGRKLEAKTLALMVLEANIVENQETKAALVVLEIAGTMAEAEYSNYCPNQILAGEVSQKSNREATFLLQIHEFSI
jgi:hypothetical protein